MNNQSEVNIILVTKGLMRNTSQQDSGKNFAQSLKKNVGLFP